MKVKIIGSERKADRVERSVNKWLSDEKSNVEVIDIKYSSSNIGNGLDTGNTYSAMIIYEPKQS